MQQSLQPCKLSPSRRYGCVSEVLHKCTVFKSHKTKSACITTRWLNRRYCRPNNSNDNRKPVWRWRRCFQLAALVPQRQAAVHETRRPFIYRDAVRIWSFPRISDRTTALHCVRVEVGELIESHGVSYHQFADDTQLLVAMNVTDAGPALVT